MVAEVWLPAKFKFSVFVGIEWICKRAKFADLFAKIFMFHQNVVTFYKKNFWGFYL